MSEQGAPMQNATNSLWDYEDGDVDQLLTPAPAKQWGAAWKSPPLRPVVLKLARWLLAVILGLSSAQYVEATTVDPPDFATLVKDSDVIFRGKVTEIRSEWTGEGSERHIASYVTFEVLRTLKGNPSTPFVLQMVGGTVGDQTLEIVGAPKFKVGDRSLLFVQKNGTQFIPLVGIMHGHLKVSADATTGEEILLKHDGSPLTGSAEIDEIHARGPLNDHEGTLQTDAERMAAKAKTAARKPVRSRDFEDEVARQATITKP